MKKSRFKIFVSLAIICSGWILSMQSCVENTQNEEGTGLLKRNKNGAVTETYTAQTPPRSGIAMGGIGTGSFEMRKDGQFYNWTIFNNWPKETGSPFSLQPGEEEGPMGSILFFMVRYQVEGEEPMIKLLQINKDLGEGGLSGIAYYFPWMKAVQNIEYSARFPFVNMKFTDPEMPFDVNLEAWSPFIPHDVKNSSLPIAYFDFEIESKTDKKVDVMIIASKRNTVAYDRPERYYTTEFVKGDDYLECNMSVGGVDTTLSSYGQLSLVSMNGESSYYGGWSARHPFYEQVLRNNKLPDLDDTDGVESILKTYDEVPEWMPVTNGRNMIDKVSGKKMAHRGSEYDVSISSCFGSVAYSKTFNTEGESFDHSFALAWNFPNKYASIKWKELTDINEGHYYSNFFNNSSDISAYAAVNEPELYQKSRKFLDDFFASDMDAWALEQVNSQLNTFITSGRLVKDGYFGVLEGLAPSNSWGPIATIDVSLYGSVPTIALFPELQKSMMRAHKNVTTEDGKVQHGLFKNFHMGEDETWNVSDRVDLPGQYIIMTARDYFWTNDREYLEDMYPSVLNALSYVLNDLDKNGDMMPDMEGQRSSYDNFPMFGLASYIQSQWLCAMASLSIIAEEMGDMETKEKADMIFQSGSELMDKYLWNGKYYRLYNDYDGIMGKNDTDEGCLTDQIIGQWAAHQSGLGDLFKHEHIEAALESILKMSNKPGKGLMNASWPGTKYYSDIDRNMWVDQGNTYWTGVELAFASFLIYEGKTDEGFEIIKAVDDRYRMNGLYFDHQEFGGHYYRPMSAWAVMNAMIGMSINRDNYTFSPKYKQAEFKHFFATPTSTAHYISEKGKVEISCLSGEFVVKSLEIDDKNLKKIESVVVEDRVAGYEIQENENSVKIIFEDRVTISSGQSILLK